MKPSPWSAPPPALLISITGPNTHQVVQNQNMRPLLFLYPTSNSSEISIRSTFKIYFKSITLPHFHCYHLDQRNHPRLPTLWQWFYTHTPDSFFTPRWSALQIERMLFLKHKLDLISPLLQWLLVTFWINSNSLSSPMRSRIPGSCLFLQLYLLSLFALFSLTKMTCLLFLGWAKFTLMLLCWLACLPRTFFSLDIHSLP